MPTKLGKGGKGQELYNENNGKYMIDGVPNKSYDNPEEQKAMDLFGLNGKASFEQQEKQEGYGRKRTFPWDWRILKVEDFDVSGLEKHRLEQLLDNYKRFMYETEKDLDDLDLYASTLSRGYLKAPDKKTMQEYEKIKEKFEKYLPKFNKERHENKEPFYDFGISGVAAMRQREENKKRLIEAAREGAKKLWG